MENIQLLIILVLALGAASLVSVYFFDKKMSNNE